MGVVVLLQRLENMAAVSTRVILLLISRVLSRIEELALTEDMGVQTSLLLMLHFLWIEGRGQQVGIRFEQWRVIYAQPG